MANAKNTSPALYGKAQEAAERILDAFRTGDIPKALAPIFIHRNDDVPCRKWSWSNQFLTALLGHDDARGIRQWNNVGRKVKKGEKGFSIFVPLKGTVKTVDEESGEEKITSYAYAFKAATVFGFGQTEGEPLKSDVEERQLLDQLPLVEVARSWGLDVQSYNGERYSARGAYCHGHSISIGVENLSTWAHELIHAADERVHGTLEPGQHADQEIVAELGGAVLLETLGYVNDADRGGCWQYVKAYAEPAGLPPLTVCQRLLSRMCDAVSHVLKTAEALRLPAPVTP